MHPKGLIVCDEDATLELHVKVRAAAFIACWLHALLNELNFISLPQTVKYFKSIEHVHQSLIGPHNLGLQGNLLRSMKDSDENTGKRRKLFLGTVLNDDREPHAASVSSTSSDGELSESSQPKKNGDTGGWKRKLESWCLIVKAISCTMANFYLLWQILFGCFPASFWLWKLTI
jgi:glucosamine-6-phosphate deaminase